ncbi:hypothetical protein BSL78_18183 [Apostichopus japonicus]|uniref:Uncharacterized protein n=1 Tax=Stichopus japonicus TaxID=307972 RepID=A0A2G8KAE8_STIJA|nr:hypothetical protein BSL78_18183 [Apostichopus japonicus]
MSARCALQQKSPTYCIVSEYPRSLKDVIGGHTIGTGYDSLLKNLTEKAQILNRGKKSKAESTVENEGRAKKRPTTTDSYGCVNYNPEMPTGEMEQKQLTQKEEMKASFQRDFKVATTASVTQNMKESHPLQRKDIIANLSIKELETERGQANLGVSSESSQERAVTYTR